MENNPSTTLVTQAPAARSIMEETTHLASNSLVYADVSTLRGEGGDAYDYCDPESDSAIDKHQPPDGICELLCLSGLLSS
ncbi:unnamed protein product [Linum trigynum]|uniref:Uncharacterized protein n=1 Tax=Linum trigynum TaxID=586398 RepID=A0AAV2DW31_9ROSI